MINLNIVDALIILMILMFGTIGLKRGVFQELAITIGTILVIVLAFYLKNPLANWMSVYLPFIDFGGSFQGLTSINIVVYQLLAFLIMCGLLGIVLRVLISLTGIFEKILKMTIILGIPSKILGAIVGLVEGFVIMFIVLFFFSQPAFNLEFMKDSKLTPVILNSTPVLSDIVKDFNNAFHDIYELSNKYHETNDKNDFNKETIDILLKYKIVTVDHIETLIDKGKLEILGIDSVLNQYR